MQDVRLNEICAENQVANNPAIVGDGYAESRFEVQTACHTVGNGTDAAYSLRKMRCVERISALKNGLESAEHRAVAFGVDDLLFAADVINCYFNCEMPFDSGYRVDFYSSGHIVFLLS